MNQYSLKKVISVTKGDYKENDTNNYWIREIYYWIREIEDYILYQSDKICHIERSHFVIYYWSEDEAMSVYALWILLKTFILRLKYFNAKNI